jgi:hypothetical protein
MVDRQWLMCVSRRSSSYLCRLEMPQVRCRSSDCGDCTDNAEVGKHVSDSDPDTWVRKVALAGPLGEYCPERRPLVPGDH